MSPPPISSDKLPQVDHSLVAEQGGFSTSLIGLTIAVVLGLLVRGVLAPDKIKTRINQAVQRIGGGLQISFDQAYISLSRGVLPDLAVVIRNAHIESAKKCWASPDAEINELRFPISIIDALAGKSFVHKVEVDRVVLLLRTEFSGCDEGRLPSSAESSVPDNSSNFSAMPKRQNTAEKKGEGPLQPDIRSLTINRLKVNYLPLPFTSFEFVDFDGDVESLEPKLFHLATGLDLGGETLSGDYSSHARIRLDYDQNQAIPLQAKVQGSWREGRYELELQNNPGNSDLDVNGEIMHIPLSQVFPLLKKYKLMVNDLNGRQTWISSKFSLHGKTSEPQRLPLKIQDLTVEGDLGEISLTEAVISQWSPLHFEPIKFGLKGVDIDKLLVFLNRPHPIQALGRLGIFDGEAIMSSNHAVQVTGVHRKLEMIFANKGSREIQEFESFGANLNFTDEKWAGEINKIQIQGGEASGKIIFEADRDWRDLEVKVDLEKLSFSPRVQHLMTQGGEANQLQFKAQAQLKKGELKRLSGVLAGDKVTVEGVQFAKPKFKFANQGEEFQVDFSGGQTFIPNVKVFEPIWSKLNQESSNLEESLKFNRISAKFRTQALQTFSWDALDLTGEKLSLSSSGGWDAKNNLHGRVQIKDKGKLKRWNITGSRALPNFTKD